MAGSVNCQYELLQFIMPLRRVPNSTSDLVRQLKSAHKLFASRAAFVLCIATSNALALVADEVRGRKKSRDCC